MIRALALALLAISPALSRAEAIKVTLLPEGGMQRSGKAYFVKGVGGREHMEELAQRGGNSVRTWSEGELPQAFESANKFKFTVCAGVWLEKECSWFSYKKPEQCARQLERIRKVVRQYRDEPQLLFWGLGNECDSGGDDEAYWKQLNCLAKMVHEEDPAHPTLYAVAGLSSERAGALNQHTPDLDLVGINTYGGVVSLPQHLVKIGWTRPWVVTEYGPRGFWECPKTTWNAPVEQTSTEKAAMIRTSYKKAIKPDGKCLGSYIFIWGHKQEATATWFGVFTKDEESTATADVLQEMWTDKKPANKAPQIKPLKCDADKVTPSQEFTIKAIASDPEDDPLQFRWEITADNGKRDANGHEIPPAPIQGLIQGSEAEVRVKAPEKPGNYRIFVFVSDGKGHAATANKPFQVTR